MRNISEFRTAELADMAKNLVKLAPLLSSLAGLCLGILALKGDKFDQLNLLALLLMIASFSLGAIATVLALNRKIIPTLITRCEELPIPTPSSNVSAVELFRKQQKFLYIGLTMFLGTIPAAYGAALLGYRFTERGFPTLVGWLIIGVFMAPGMYLILKASQCPSCKKLLRGSTNRLKSCPYCGAILRNDQV